MGQMILRNIEIFGNKMEYIVDRDYGAGILNTGVVYCMNCTFHDNKAKYGGAIYNQGLLVVTNSSFYSNNGYGKGDDIVNVDHGIVSVDGENFEACGGKNIVYLEGLSSAWQTGIKIACYAGSFVLGAVAGIFTANPFVGIAVGAAIGSAVGGVGSSVICSNVYDINFCRWSCALTLTLGSAGAGAIGGQIGGVLGSCMARAAAYNSFLCELQIADILDSHSIEAMVRSTVFSLVLGENMAIAAHSIPDAILTPTVAYTNPDDLKKVLSSDSNTIIVSSDLIHSIKLDKDNGIQVVNAFINATKSSFSEDEVLDVISTIDSKKEGLDSILY